MKRKKSFIVIPCAAVCCLGLFSVSALAEKPEAAAHQAASPVTIDGSLDEWDLSSPIEINSESQVIRDQDSWLGETDVSCTAYLMWDEENLYFAADTKEASPLGAVGLLAHNMEDNFKLYISTDPAADPDRTAYGTNDFLLYLMMDSQNWYTAFDRSMVERDVMGRFTSAGMENNEQVLEGYEAAYTTTEDGFILEAVIPWANFSNEYIEAYVPQAGDAVGFDLCITDNDYPFPNTQSSVQLSWSGNAKSDKDPSLWGRITFE